MAFWVNSSSVCFSRLTFLFYQVQSGTTFADRDFFYFTRQLSPTDLSSPDVYLKKKIALSLVGISVALVYIALLTFTGLKNPFINLASVSQNIYIRFLLFIFAIEILFSIIKFPFDYYADFIVEHRFNLSNQTFSKWLLRKLKAALIGSMIGVVLLIAFYFLLVNSPKMWWLLFAAFYFLFQILAAQLFPTVILPMFYKLKPLSNNVTPSGVEGNKLHSRLNTLVERFGYRMSGVFSFDLSRETRKANAALTGLGRSRKIIISDTLLENFSNDEIEVVLAHELGHLVKHHMMKGISISGAASLIGLYIVAQIYSVYTAALHVLPYNLEAIPFLALVLTIFGVIAMPLGNLYSRKIEHEADLFALSTTGMKKEFAESMRKLGRLNLTPENPPAWIEKIFFSHPSIGARIRAALPVEDPARGKGMSEANG